ncbi:MAG: hypothetical protein AAFU66_11250 [Pseudomonadota bacterium]
MRNVVATIFLLGFALPAQAQCYADYKAKRDNPLRLHYGVVEVTDQLCSRPARLESSVRDRVSAGGWTLLNIVSVFDAEGLEQRRESAGEFFLRF